VGIVRYTRIALGAAVLSLLGPDAFAQGEISGRVTTADSARVPVVGAEAVIPLLRRSVATDSSGRFRLKDLPTGLHVLVIRAIGFRAESSTVEIQGEDVMSLDIRLEYSGATRLPERVVTAPGERPTPANLVEFNERRKFGTGHFIDRSQLAKAEDGMRQTGDLIATIPGVVVRRGSNRIWVATGRAIGTGCAFCAMTVAGLNPADVAAGARPACFVDVYLDGALVFDSRRASDGLFDINSVPPVHIAGIEVYTSAAQIPAKYNRTGNGCGVLLIWTR
jgi:carboxypeptidase family protein